MGDFSVQSHVIDDIDTFMVALHGENRFTTSRANAEKLVQRFQATPYRGLIIDYRDSVLGHQMSEYRQIAETFANGFPAGQIVAYVFDDSQVTHIMLMTRTLAAQGFRVRAFSTPELARDWIANQLDANIIAFDAAQKTG